MVVQGASRSVVVVEGSFVSHAVFRDGEKREMYTDADSNVQKNELGGYAWHGRNPIAIFRYFKCCVFKPATFV